jgi:Flp pilus assembly protein TadG
MLDKGTLMPRNRRSNKRQKGFAFIYVTLVGTFLLLPMAGLAVDFGMLYNVKARLQTAVDAAAIGAGYMLHASTDISNPTQLAAIEAAAQAYFNANFPAHYFGSTVLSYGAVVATTASGKTITVNASATVPLLLLRVLGIQASTVGATAVSNVRYIAMMIVVDRSGSVVGEPGAQSEITTTLQSFVGNSLTSTVVDGVDTVGMVSFGASWKLDYAPNLHFQTATPNIGTAISHIDFAGTNSTNTAEGLYQAWTQLYSMNLPGSLNVILLLTDGRPSAFTGKFAMVSGCNNPTNYINGSLQAYVNQNPPYPFWPPPPSGNVVLGLLGTQLLGSYPNWTAETSALGLATPHAGCAFATNPTGSPTSELNINLDLPSGGNFPSTAGPVDNVGLGSNPSYQYYLTPGSGIPTQSGYYPNPGTNSNDPRSVRYAAFNVADNMATMIRTDTTLSPMLFVIGLNYTTGLSEPLDADWLARLANDPNYVTVGTDPTIKAAGLSVYQNGQTPGMYCGGTVTTLGVCFAQVTSSLLRLIQ